MIISAIVAMTPDRVIGKDNAIPWHLPADLKKFRLITTPHHIIMGRKCYESIGKALPGRPNIVITRNRKFHAEGCQVVHHWRDAIEVAEKAGESECFIIGGAEIYQQTMLHWDKMYVTMVHTTVPHGDTWFPQTSDSEWFLVSEEHHQPDERNAYAYDFQIFERRTWA